MHRPSLSVTAGLLCAALSLLATPASAVSVAASNNATVQPGGPRSGTNGLRFFNMEGSANGSISSYGVVDFTLAATPAVSVDSLSLALTESNAAFTAPGALRFFVVSNSSASIAAGASALVFDASSLPNGLGAQLGTKYLLGTGAFTTTGNTHNGQVDTYAFTLSGAGKTFVTSVANAGGVLRLVVAPDDATVAATFQGYTNTKPQMLNMQTSAVPEPASCLVMLAGLGTLGVAMRRRQA